MPRGHPPGSDCGRVSLALVSQRRADPQGGARPDPGDQPGRMQPRRTARPPTRLAAYPPACLLACSRQLRCPYYVYMYSLPRHLVYARLPAYTRIWQRRCPPTHNAGMVYHGIVACARHASGCGRLHQAPTPTHDVEGCLAKPPPLCPSLLLTRTPCCCATAATAPCTPDARCVSLCSGRRLPPPAYFVA